MRTCYLLAYEKELELEDAALLKKSLFYVSLVLKQRYTVYSYTIEKTALSCDHNEGEEDNSKEIRPLKYPELPNIHNTDTYIHS